jgi:hypothetical protein
MTFEQSPFQNADKLTKRDTNPSLLHELFHDTPTTLFYRSSDKDNDFTDKLLGKVTLSDNYSKNGKTKNDKKDDKQADNKTADKPTDVQKKSDSDTQNEPKKEDKPEEDKQPQPESPAVDKEVWGGDEKATKSRHLPLDVQINADGSATVTVKAGDTAWDVVRRMLQEQGKATNPPSEPTNKQIYDKVKEYEKEHGSLSVLRPGQTIKISSADVLHTDFCRGRITDDDGKGTKHVYTRDTDGKWKDENGKEVKVEEDKDGTVTITDSDGNTSKHTKDGKVEHKQADKKEDATKEKEEQDKKQKEEQERQKQEEEKTKNDKAQQQQTFTTNGGDYTVMHRDANGVPDEMTVTKDGKAINYKRSGDGWQSDESGQMKTVENMNVTKGDDGTIKIVIRTKDPNGDFVETVKLTTDGKGTDDRVREVVIDPNVD